MAKKEDAVKSWLGRPWYHSCFVVLLLTANVVRGENVSAQLVHGDIERNKILALAANTAISSDVYQTCWTETQVHCVEATAAVSSRIATRLLKQKYPGKRDPERQLTPVDRGRMAAYIRRRWNAGGPARASIRAERQVGFQQFLFATVAGDFAGCSSVACEVGAGLNGEIPLLGDAVGVLAGTYYGGWQGFALGVAGFLPGVGAGTRVAKLTSPADLPRGPGRSGKPPKAIQTLDVERIQAEANAISDMHYSHHLGSPDRSELLRRLRQEALTNFRGETAPALPELLFHGTTVGNFPRIVDRGLRPGSHPEVYFKQGGPDTNHLGISLVLPTHRGRALGGAEGLHTGVFTIPGDSGIPFEEFAVVYAFERGFVVPLYVPAEWEGPVGNVIDVSKLR